jgi:putative tricarboxylic transport membrane protein
MKNIDRGEMAIPIVLIVLSISLFVKTYGFEFTTHHQAPPTLWPRAIIVLLVLVCGMLIGKLILEGRKKGAGRTEKSESETQWGMVLKGILVLFLYMFLMSYVGYILSTMAFTLAAMLMLGNRSKVHLILTPLLTTGLVFIIFTHAMYIPLPKGISVFRTFSQFFH